LGWPRLLLGCANAATESQRSTLPGSPWMRLRLADAGLIAIYLPMHTATRLAAQLIPQLRKQNPRAHSLLLRLVRPMNVDYLRALGVSTILGGEFEEKSRTPGGAPGDGRSAGKRTARGASDLHGPLAVRSARSIGNACDGEVCAPHRSRGRLPHRWFDGSEPWVQAFFAGIAQSCRFTRECFESSAATW